MSWGKTLQVGPPQRDQVAARLELPGPGQWSASSADDRRKKSRISFKTRKPFTSLLKRLINRPVKAQHHPSQSPCVTLDPCRGHQSGLTMVCLFVWTEEADVPAGLSLENPR